MARVSATSYNIRTTAAEETAHKRGSPGWAKYCVVVTPLEPIFIVRMPTHNIPWRKLLACIGDIVVEHGGLKKDISAVEAVGGLTDATANSDYALKEDATTVAKLDAAFAGDKNKFKDFWLYAWDDNEQFKLVRPGEKRKKATTA